NSRDSSSGRWSGNGGMPRPSRQAPSQASGIYNSMIYFYIRLTAGPIVCCATARATYPGALRNMSVVGRRMVAAPEAIERRTVYAEKARGVGQGACALEGIGHAA